MKIQIKVGTEHEYENRGYFQHSRAKYIISIPIFRILMYNYIHTLTKLYHLYIIVYIFLYIFKFKKF